MRRHHGYSPRRLMRIAFVSREVVGVRGGGIGTYVAEAGKALTSRGHEVWLFTDEPAPERIEGFARVVVVRASETPRIPFLYGAPHYEYAYRVHETLQASGVSFDYVEFADYQAEGLVALREQQLFRSYGDTVMAVTLHSPSYECYRYNGQLHRANQLEWETFSLEDDLLRDVEFLNSPSLGLRDLVCDRLGRDRDDVAIVRYPMELPNAVPIGSQPESLADFEFVYFGRIEPRKGVAELVDAFRRMPDLRLRIIGADTPFSPYGGSLREWLTKQPAANVRVDDALPRDELLRVIAQSPVCILPSRFENWPNACIEAMALGRVVIGGRHGGMSEMIVDGESGFTVDGEDADDIVRVVRGLDEYLARFGEIGANAAHRIRELADPAAYCDTIERTVAARAATLRAREPSTAEPLVSIVIPFYRDRDTVDAAVRSANEQSYANLEILVVNDGSPLEDAASILARIEGSDSRVRVLHKENGGLSSARNHGIRHAKGEFLLFLDADNALRPDYARCAVAALLARPDAGFAVPHVRFFDDATGADVGIFNPLPFVRGFSLMINRFGDAGAFFRKQTLVELGLDYDELLISFEDWALWIDLARRGVRGCALPRVLYDYRMRVDSMMQADAWPNFRALIGLLIERHLTDDQEERELLWMLNQTWGRDAKEFDRVREERGRWPVRYVFVDKVYGLAKKLGLGGVADRLGRALRRH